MSLEVSFIIVNWNGGELLRQCVDSIVTHAQPGSYEIVVIDNASTDGSREWLDSQIDRLQIVKNDENAGFGRANNQAFELSQAEFLFLLNPDARLLPGAIETLMATMKSDAGIGACGPRVVHEDGSFQVSVWHNPQNVWQILLSQLKLYMILPRRLRGELLLGPHWDHDRRRTVPMLSGAAMLVRRRTIETAGGFDERFHMYGEDMEWCWRIRAAGWRIVFEPAASVIHHGGQSAKQRWTELEKVRVRLESAYSFEAQVLPHWRLVANRLAYYFTSSAQKAWYRVRRRPRLDIDLAQQIHRAQLSQSLRR